MTRTAAALLLCAAALSAGGTEIPQAVIPNGVGVNIHFIRGQERDLDMIREAGFKWVRMDFTWEATEKTRGEYDWSAYDELTSNLSRHGLAAIYILDYSNPLYEEHNEAPHHPESIAAYAKWAALAARHYLGRPIIWEIWNEPNGGFWKPKANVTQYNAMATAAAAAIREAAPHATIVGPACAGFDWGFMESFLQSGILSNLDAVTMHPYRDIRAGPETAARDYRRLRGLIEKYAPAGKKQMPILSGEWGYSTQKGGASLETQAAYAVRQQLANVLNNVPLSIWYDWKNDGPDAGYNEHNFGVVSNDLRLKPAYTALQTMTRQLAGCTLRERIAPQDGDYLLVFDGPGGRKLVAWTTGAPHPVTTGFGEGKPRSGVDGMGREFAPRLEGGKLRLELEPLPKYIF